MKNELMIFEKNHQAVVSSRIIAERFGKRHGDIITKLEGKERKTRNRKSEIGLIEQVGSTGNPAEAYFIKNYYYDTQNGERYTEYLCTRDGFSLLVMGFTGRQSLEWKLKYIETFNSMESLIKERQTTEWLQTRQQGKLIRREETDTIQDFIFYAEKQGSKNAGKYYMTFTKLVNKAVGVESGTREFAAYKDLMLIVLLEDMICHTVAESIEKGVYYKEIYKICKDKVRQFSQLTYLKSA